MNLVEGPAIDKNHLQKSGGLEGPHPCAFLFDIGHRVHLKPPSKISLPEKIEIGFGNKTERFVRPDLLDIGFNDGAELVERFYLDFFSRNEAFDNFIETCGGLLRSYLLV